MAKYKPLTAAQRKERKEIRELIRKARDITKIYHSRYSRRETQAICKGFIILLDDLADIAEKYLKGLK